MAAWQGSGHKKYPHTPGHEFCGLIEQISSNVSDLTRGQRVVIDPNLGYGDCRFCQMGKPNLCDYLKSRPIKGNGGPALCGPRRKTGDNVGNGIRMNRSRAKEDPI